MELTSRAVLQWCSSRRIEWRYIAQGKPMQNGFVENLNGHMCKKLFSEMTSATCRTLRCNRRLGARMALRTLLKYPAPADYARSLTTARPLRDAKASRSGRFPCPRQLASTLLCALITGSFASGIFG